MEGVTLFLNAEPDNILLREFTDMEISPLPPVSTLLISPTMPWFRAHASASFAHLNAAVSSSTTFTDSGYSIDRLLMPKSPFIVSNFKI